MSPCGISRQPIMRDCQLDMFKKSCQWQLNYNTSFLKKASPTLDFIIQRRVGQKYKNKKVSEKFRSVNYEWCLLLYNKL